MRFNRRAILETAAAQACEAIQHYREMLREELTRERISQPLVAWIRARHRAQQKRWAKAAALIARLDLTLEERRMLP